MVAWPLKHFLGEVLFPLDNHCDAVPVVDPTIWSSKAPLQVISLVELWPLEDSHPRYNIRKRHKIMVSVCLLCLRALGRHWSPSHPFLFLLSSLGLHSLPFRCSVVYASYLCSPLLRLWCRHLNLWRFKWGRWSSIRLNWRIDTPISCKSWWRKERALQAFQRI